MNIFSLSGFLATVFFAGVLVAGISLKRSFVKELKQRNKLEKLTKKLKENNKNLKDLDRAKNEFISIVAHQLRTPPTVIKGYINLVQENLGNNVDKQTKESLGKALISNERLIDLVNDMLNISRIESGDMKYKMRKGDIYKDILVNLYEAFKIKAKAKGLYINLEKPKEALPKIKIDVKKIQEVVSNLIDNAIKYTHEGGVTIKTRRTKNNIRIEINDTGIGIARDEIAYLFKKFSRGKNSDTLEVEGTGLGIYVGKKIAKEHGGKIWAESKGVNKGSTFIIELPINSKTEVKNLF